MAISVIQSAQGTVSIGGTAGITFPAVNARNRIIFVVSELSDQITPGTVTDDKGNVYSLDGTTKNNTMAGFIYSGFQVVGGATKGTVSIASGVANVTLSMLEVSGISHNSYINNSSMGSSNSGGNTTGTVISFTTSLPNTIIVSGGAQLSGSQGTAGSGFTFFGTAENVAQYQILSGTAVVTSPMSMADNAWCLSAVAYQTNLSQSSGTAALGLGSISAVWPSNTTTGNLVTVGVNLTNATTLGTVTSITDSQSNTYTKAISGTRSTVLDVMDTELWYASNITGVPAISLAGSLGTIADSSTVTGTYTFSNGVNRALVVAAGAHQQTVGTVTLNGTALTQIVQGTTAFNEQINLWYFNSPPAGAAGTISVVANGASGVGFIATEWNNVAQSGQPIGSANSNLGASAAARGTLTTTTNNNVLIGGFYSEAIWNAEQSTGQIGIIHQNAQSFEAMALSYLPQTSAGAGTMGWGLASSQRWASAMIALQPVYGSVTVNHTTDACSVYVREYSGYNTLDVTQAANGSSTSPNTGTVTTNFANELVVVANGDDNGVSQTWSAAGAYGDMIGTATTLTGISMESNVISSTGAQTGTLTLGNAANWSGLLATFYKLVVSAGVPGYKTLLGGGR